MPSPTEGATRARVLAVARELFGVQGYKPTTIAQIERAAGLSPGAGGFYRHFASKRALLEAVLADQIDTGPDLAAFMSGGESTGDVRAQLFAVARAGLRRLDHERDLNRLLLRDLPDFADLLARVRDSELRRVHGGLAGWLRARSGAGALDAAAVATVLMGAVSHYWIMTDVFGGVHPFHTDEESFLEALVDMTVSAFGTPAAE